MPIDVNNYNAQFSQFVQFAERQMQAGKAKAFASLGAEGATGLAARDIKPGSGDSVHAWIRYKDSKIANDAVRELFRQSVAAMFGGNDRIPEDVQKAMLLTKLLPTTENNSNNGKLLTKIFFKLLT